jgi:hypothetical protein
MSRPHRIRRCLGSRHRGTSMGVLHNTRADCFFRLVVEHQGICAQDCGERIAVANRQDVGGSFHRRPLGRNQLPRKAIYRTSPSNPGSRTDFASRFWSVRRQSPHQRRALVALGRWACSTTSAPRRNVELLPARRCLNGSAAFLDTTRSSPSKCDCACACLLASIQRAGGRGEPRRGARRGKLGPAHPAHVAAGARQGLA